MAATVTIRMSFLGVIMLISFASATVWHGISTVVPTEVFLFKGSMLVPKTQPHGTFRPYLWPGLQNHPVTGKPTEKIALLQSVLDGHPGNADANKAGSWYFGGNLYETNVAKLPPHGGGFNVERGSTVHWEHAKLNRNGGWSIKETDQNGKSATHNFVIDQTLYWVSFVVELQDGMPWDFGPVIFTDITIAAFGRDTTWCTREWDHGSVAWRGAMLGVHASVESGHSVCRIDRLVIAPP